MLNFVRRDKVFVTLSGYFVFLPMYFQSCMFYQLWYLRHEEEKSFQFYRQFLYQELSICHGPLGGVISNTKIAARFCVVKCLLGSEQSNSAVKCFILAYYRTWGHVSALSSIGSGIQAAFTSPALKENYIEPFGKEILETPSGICDGCGSSTCLPMPKCCVCFISRD